VKWTRGTRNDDVIDVRGRRGSAAKLGGGGIGFETGRLEACDTFSVQEL
jgi:hypothetical protein